MNGLGCRSKNHKFTAMGKNLPSLKKRLWLTLLLSIFSLITINSIIAYSSSEDKFSGDIQKFPTELSNLLRRDITTENENILKDFTKFWTVDSVLNDDQKTRIVSASTVMLNKTLSSKNHFFTYINLIMFFLAR